MLVYCASVGPKTHLRLSGNSQTNSMFLTYNFCRRQAAYQLFMSDEALLGREPQNALLFIFCYRLDCQNTSLYLASARKFLFFAGVYF